jgi:hypothetical protein
MIIRSVLWKVLCEYGVNGRLLNAVKSMYDGSKACVRVNGSLSEWFEVKRGVRQGCVMSPWLFNVFMDKCVRMASRDMVEESEWMMHCCWLRVRRNCRI